MGRPKKPKEAEAPKLTHELDIPVGTAAARAIQYRGPRQFRVQIRRKGLERKNVFESLEEAIQWRDKIEDLADGTYKPDHGPAQTALLRDVCTWMLDKINGPPYPSDHIKNKCSHWRWWRDKSPFADHALNMIQFFDLIEWRDKIMMVDVGDDTADAAEALGEVGKLEGATTPPSAQTVIHRLNALSDLYKAWCLHNKLPDGSLLNPVRQGVRPKKDDGRNRRLNHKPDENGLTEMDRLLEAARGQEKRPWLSYAIFTAVETALRQTELATLEWSRVRLDGDEPSIYLSKTKNGQQRTVPLSPEVIEKLRELRDVVQPAVHEAWRQSRLARKEPVEGDGVNPPWPAHKVLPVESGRGIIHAWRDMIHDVREAEYERLIGDGVPEESAAEQAAMLFNDLRWHDLRHEAVSRLFETSDMSETEIMAMVGHMSKEILMRYTHHRTARLAAKLSTRRNVQEGPGSLRLVVGLAPLVKGVDGKWINLADADLLLRNNAKFMLQAALTQIEQAEAREMGLQAAEAIDEDEGD